MSKYKDQANKILENIANKNTDENGERIYYSWEVEKAMCQLAEEVEDSFKHIELYKRNKKLEKALSETVSILREKEKTLYTKSQVEELLQKQRELCAEKAELIGTGDEFDEVDQDSILNAKLKIN